MQTPFTPYFVSGESLNAINDLLDLQKELCVILIFLRVGEYVVVRFKYSVLVLNVDINLDCGLGR